MDHRLSDTEERWTVTGSETLHRDAWVVALRADTVVLPDGSGEVRRVVLEHPGAAVVLALDAEDRVCCVAQYRHAAGRRFVELPAGLLDHGDEEPLEVARRELQEEVGLAANSWTHLGSTYSSPGVSQEVMHLYLARGLTDVGHGDFDLEHEEADMDVFWVPFAELHDAVVAGRLTDGPLVTAVLLAAARGSSLGAPHTTV